MFGPVMLHSWLGADTLFLDILSRARRYVLIRMSLFCGGGNHGDFAGSDGFYRDLPAWEYMFVCMCVCVGGPFI